MNRLIGFVGSALHQCQSSQYLLDWLCLSLSRCDSVHVSHATLCFIIFPVWFDKLVSVQSETKKAFPSFNRHYNFSSFELFHMDFSSILGGIFWVAFAAFLTKVPYIFVIYPVSLICELMWECIFFLFRSSKFLFTPILKSYNGVKAECHSKNIWLF